MKAVLISIRPKWCEKIASGQKTIEVRKNRPKIETPFKCFIYSTKGEKTLARGVEILNGCVIGEFICDSIETIGVPYPAYRNEMRQDVIDRSCLSYAELHHYAGSRTLYGWHISDLVIYDIPKVLSDFYKPCPMNRQCTDCIYGFPWGASSENISCNYFHLNKVGQLTRPPQSWCYVEEL